MITVYVIIMNKSKLGTIVVLLFAAIILSGCTGILSDTEVNFSSSPATLNNSTMNDSGYEKINQTTIKSSDNISFQDFEKEISITNHLTVYETNFDRQSSEEPNYNQEVQNSGSRTYLFTTPVINVSGQNINPVADFTNREMIEFFFPQYMQTYSESDTIKISSESSSNVDIFDKKANKSTYEVSSSRHTWTIVQTVEITKTVHEGDSVIVLRVTPNGPEESGSISFQRLLNGIKHT